LSASDYPPDSDFGRSAAEDQEKVDRLEDEGVDESSLDDEPAREPRAGGKAEPAGDGARETGDRDAAVDEASEQSFPASDPPSSNP
jgi:hypothetical protein